MKFLQEANYDWMDMLNFTERPFRAKFTPAKIWQDLDRYRNDSVGLANYFKKWRTKIQWFTQKSKAQYYKTHIAVGGEYSPEDRQCTIQIYTTEYNTFAFTEKTWERFKYKLIQVTMHEMIHFMQFDRRDNEWSEYTVPYKKVGNEKKDSAREYLSSFDEIQAYAHCILLDYKTRFPDTPIAELISRSSYRNDSSTMKYILRTFDYDYRNNHAIPKLMQQIVKWDRKYKRFLHS
jgi:hypothetical protein